MSINGPMYALNYGARSGAMTDQPNSRASETSQPSNLGGNSYPDSDDEKFSRLYTLVDVAVQRLEEMTQQVSKKPLSIAGI